MRRLVPADRDTVFRGLSDPRVIAHYGVSYATPEATQAQMNWFEEIFAQGTGVWWGICRPANPSDLLGAVGINDLCARHRRAELGYWLLPEHWRQGVAQECVAALLRHAYEDMHLYRVGAEVDIGNARSIRLLGRLGFQYEGTRRGYESKNGRPLDLLFFARLAADTAPQQPLGRSTMPRRLISSGSPFEEQIAYSRAVVEDEWIFVSGTTGFDYATMSISDSTAEQAEQCLKNVQHALREAGAELADVVRVTYILPSGDDFRDCWPVLRRHFDGVRPAATMICAGLLDPRMKIEIEVTARRRRDG
jgi:ribosomal-protein-alanine N-acetyltransferase